MIKNNTYKQNWLSAPASEREGVKDRITVGYSAERKKPKVRWPDLIGVFPCFAGGEGQEENMTCTVMEAAKVMLRPGSGCSAVNLSQLQHRMHRFRFKFVRFSLTFSPFRTKMKMSGAPEGAPVCLNFCRLKWRWAAHPSQRKYCWRTTPICHHLIKSEVSSQVGALVRPSLLCGVAAVSEWLGIL